MTRKKVNLEFIENDSARKATFKKRKKGFLKKMYELTTLCEIEAAAVIYSPYDAQPEAWPSVNGAHRVLTKFRRMPEMEKTKKMLNQEAFLRQRIAKANEQLRKQQKDNRQKEMSQIMHDCLGGKESVQKIDLVKLTDLGWLIDQNLKEIYKRIETLKKKPPQKTQKRVAMTAEVALPPLPPGPPPMALEQVQVRSMTVNGNENMRAPPGFGHVKMLHNQNAMPVRGSWFMDIIGREDSLVGGFGGGVGSSNNGGLVGGFGGGIGSISGGDNLVGSSSGGGFVGGFGGIIGSSTGGGSLVGGGSNGGPVGGFGGGDGGSSSSGGVLAGRFGGGVGSSICGGNFVGSGNGGGFVSGFGSSSGGGILVGGSNGGGLVGGFGSNAGSSSEGGILGCGSNGGGLVGGFGGGDSGGNFVVGGFGGGAGSSNGGGNLTGSNTGGSLMGGFGGGVGSGSAGGNFAGDGASGSSGGDNLAGNNAPMTFADFSSHNLSSAWSTNDLFP